MVLMGQMTGPSAAAAPTAANSNGIWVPYPHQPRETESGMRSGGQTSYLVVVDGVALQ